MDLDVARLGAPEADEAGDDDDHNVDDSQTAFMESRLFHRTTRNSARETQQMV